jgi:putative phosphoribosyl transferase
MEATGLGGMVSVPCEGAQLEGDLEIPAGARAAVLFAHGTGSNRRAPRNLLVARRLQQRGFATLLVDLLTPDEEKVDLRTAEYRFDTDLLGWRLTQAADWLCARLQCLPGELGCFGASTGAAAALIAAANRPELVGALVSRGGRLDLAGTGVTARVRAPTLLIVGGLDSLVIVLNRQALEHLPGEKQLQIVPGATQLFDEPGGQEIVADRAAAWFDQHLGLREEMLEPVPTLA